MKLKESEVVWFNGELVPWGEARVHVLSHALHYASSTFEGLRAYATPAGPAVVCLDAHVERLFRSARILHLPIPFTLERIRRAILETVTRNGHDACYIRPLVFRGYAELGVWPGGCPVEVAIGTWEHGTHFGVDATERGVTVGVSSWRRMAPDTHPAMAKSAANYLNSQLILLEARRHGYDDGIALDSEGYACETHGANLFVVLDGRVITPPLEASILPGITRACVIRLAREMGHDLVEARIAREMLTMASEVFLTGTAAEVTPVRAIDGEDVGDGGRGPITERLQQAYFELVRGRVPDRHGWLTPVR